MEIDKTTIKENIDLPYFKKKKKNKSKLLSRGVSENETK